MEQAVIRFLEQLAVDSFRVRDLEQARAAIQLMAYGGHLSPPLAVLYAMILTEQRDEDRATEILAEVERSLGTLPQDSRDVEITRFLLAVAGDLLPGGSMSAASREELESSAMKWIPRGSSNTRVRARRR